MNERQRDALAIVEGHHAILEKAAKALTTKGHTNEAQALSEAADFLKDLDRIKTDLVRPVGYPDPGSEGIVWPSWDEVMTAVSDYRSAYH
jgi:hypothetical protein